MVDFEYTGLECMYRILEVSSTDNAISEKNVEKYLISVIISFLGFFKNRNREDRDRVRRVTGMYTAVGSRGTRVPNFRVPIGTKFSSKML